MILKKQELRLTRYSSILFVSFCLSCSTTDLDLEPTLKSSETIISSEIVVRNGILSFRKLDSYIHLIDEGDINERRNLIANLNSIKEYAPLRSLSANSKSKNGKLKRTLSTEEENLIEANEFITTLLNESGLITIGEYIFKINLAEQICLVLPRAFESQIDDLVTENTNNSNIMIFSTNDDVLYLLEEGSKGTINGRSQLFCTQSGASAKEDKDFDYESDRFRMDNKVVYQKVAVYFSLQSKTKTQYKSDTGIWVENSDCGQRIQYYYHIKPKCKSDFEAEGFVEDTGCGNELNLRAYERSYGINKYWFATVFYGYSFWSRDYEIRDGY